jgi:hypothetical protein
LRPQQGTSLHPGCPEHHELTFRNPSLEGLAAYELNGVLEQQRLSWESVPHLSRQCRLDRVKELSTGRRGRQNHIITPVMRMPRRNSEVGCQSKAEDAIEDHASGEGSCVRRCGQAIDDVGIGIQMDEPGLVQKVERDTEVRARFLKDKEEGERALSRAFLDPRDLHLFNHSHKVSGTPVTRIQEHPGELRHRDPDGG